MDFNEEKYKKRIEEVNTKLQSPKLKKKIDTFLRSLTKELECDVEILFNVYPEVDEYSEYMDSEDFKVPNEIDTEFPSMKLFEFIDHIKQEELKYNVYIDPIYLRKGLNEINDILTTTVDNNVIIVPVSHKNKNNKNEKNKISN